MSAQQSDYITNQLRRGIRVKNNEQTKKFVSDGHVQSNSQLKGLQSDGKRDREK